MINEGIFAGTMKPVAMAVDADGHLITADGGGTGFVPTGTASLSATQASGRVALAATGDVLSVRNYGSWRVYIKLGGGTVTAATTDYPVDPYTCEVFSRDITTETYLAAICDTGGTASLIASTGSGGFATGTTPAITGSIAVSSMPTASTAMLSNVSGSASSVTLLAANSARKGAVIHNDSTAILYLKFGATASATSFTYKLNGGETWESNISPLYVGVIDGIWASATGAARVTELT